MGQHSAYRNPALWGIVLAAGDGRRLENFIKQTRGDDLPKQYCNFIGRRSMLEHTYNRIKSLIPPQRILTVIAKHHLKYPEVCGQLAQQPEANIIIQPQNKETGPGIFLPSMHLYKRCPDAIAVIFPSDHFILEEVRFMAYVDRAARAVACDPSRLVLLAIEATSAETELGYVVPSSNNRPYNRDIRKIAAFIEKPDVPTARHLIHCGALWNTMIAVFNVTTLLKMLRLVYPVTYRRFFSLFAAIGTRGEVEAIDELYRTLQPMNFSKDFLEKVTVVFPERVSVLPVRRVFWSDWGSPVRVWETREALAKSQPMRQKPLSLLQREVTGRKSTYYNSAAAQRRAG